VKNSVSRLGFFILVDDFSSGSAEEKSHLKISSAFALLCFSGFLNLQKQKKRKIIPMAIDLRNSSPTSDSFLTQQRHQNIHWSDSSSSLCSGFDSELCSTESESDDYIAELTRQMGQYMLRDFDDSLIQGNLKVEDDESPVSEFQKKQALIDEQIRSVQKREGPVKEEKEAIQLAEEEKGSEAIKRPVRRKRGKKKGQKGAAGDGGGGGCSGVMRAVFLGVPGRGGTGVFLPAAGVEIGTNSSSESRSKSGCSTVLMPGRVVQALKLHFDKIGPSPSPINPPAAAAVASSMSFQQGTYIHISYEIATSRTLSTYTKLQNGIFILKSTSS
ncbi:hypothetical protein LINPERHAP2_LOCUS27021, partial [Linum perenne]